VHGKTVQESAIVRPSADKQEMDLNVFDTKRIAASYEECKKCQGDNKTRVGGANMHTLPGMFYHVFLDRIADLNQGFEKRLLTMYARNSGGGDLAPGIGGVLRWKS